MLLPYSLLLAVDGFFSFHDVAMEDTSPLYQMCFSWLEGLPVLNVVFTATFIFIQAVMINRLVIHHRMSRMISLLPGVAYILLMNALPDTRGMQPVIMANFLAILLLSNTFPIIRLYNTEKRIFNMGFWAALAGFFFPGYFIMVLFILVAMAILRNFSLKELGQAVTGFVTVVILMGTLFYVRGDTGAFWDAFGTFKLNNWGILVSFGDLKSTLVLIVTYLLLIICLFNYYKLLAKQTIREQKKIKLTYWFLVLLLPGLWLVPQLMAFDILTLAIPMAVIIGIVMANWKMKMAAEFIHLVVVMGILYLHFQ